MKKTEEAVEFITEFIESILQRVIAASITVGKLGVMRNFGQHSGLCQIFGNDQVSSFKKFITLFNLGC